MARSFNKPTAGALGAPPWAFTKRPSMAKGSFPTALQHGVLQLAGEQMLIASSSPSASIASMASSSLFAPHMGYCTEKFVVEVDCRSPEATVVVTSYLPARAFAGRVMGKAELYVPVWRATSIAGFATSSP